MTGDIVITDDPSTCPRCGSKDVNWCGSDMDGQGGYYHMYLCEACGRKEEGVEVFLVPCSEEEYGHDPRALPRDPDTVLSAPYELLPRIKVCPECGSDDIGQLDEGLPLDTKEYEYSGGRYYCLRCGWTESYGSHTGVTSWAYNWPAATCSRCGRVISNRAEGDEIPKDYSYLGWINPENPDEILCHKCYQKKSEPWWKFW